MATAAGVRATASTGWPSGAATRAGSAAPPSDLAAKPWCRVVQYADAYAVQFGGADPPALATRLAALKGAIPPQRRRWEAATRTWWVDPIAERMVRALSHWVDRWFALGQVERSTVAHAAGWASHADSGDTVTEGWVPTAQPGERGAAAPDRAVRPSAGEAARPGEPRPALAAAPPVDETLAAAYATLWLRPGAPPEVVKAAYRALAAIHHPDKGGDQPTMQRVNAAYAVLRDRSG